MKSLVFVIAFILVGLWVRADSNAPQGPVGSNNEAQFNDPGGLAVDGSGNVYVADNRNDTIRKITPSGTVTTLAGTAGQSGSSDGTGKAAQFNNPGGLAVDGSGNVYIADMGNDTIREISPTGVVTTLAGSAGQSGSNDGTGTEARFCTPSNVAVDGSGNPSRHTDRRQR